MITEPATDGLEVSLLAHLDTCRSCQQRLEQLSGADEWQTTVDNDNDDGDVDAVLSDQDFRELYQLGRAEHTQSLTKLLTHADKPVYSDAAGSLLTPTDDDDCIGYFGEFRVLEVLGQGGMGIVFRAIEPVLDRIVAIKVLSPQVAGSSRSRQRFLSEARAVASINHPGVVGIYQVSQHGSLPYIVMPCVDGESLEALLQRKGSLEIDQTIDIAIQVCDALDAAHAAGIVHRDIKPGNLLIEQSSGRVRVTDFGIARAASDASLTQTGFIAGTPQYMSPEHASGNTVDHRSDLYSLGVVIYTMLVGRPPFTGEHPLSVIQKIIHETPRSVADVWSETNATREALPNWLCELVHRTLMRSPEDRPQSASELRRCLLARDTAELPSLPAGLSAAARTDQITSAGTSLQPVAKSRWRTRGQVLVATAALMLAVMVVVAGGWTSSTRDIDTTNPSQPITAAEAAASNETTVSVACTLQTKDGTRTDHRSLELALSAASDGDTVCLLSAGPYVLSPATVLQSSLHLRGQVPPGETPATICVDTSAGSWTIEQDLQLTDVIVRSADAITPVNTKNGSTGGALLMVGQGHLLLTRCLVVSDSLCLAIASSARMTADSSLLVSLGQQQLINFDMDGHSNVVIRNCILSGQTVFAVDGSGVGSGCELHLRDSTLYGDIGFALRSGGPAALGLPSLRVESRGNVFQADFLQAVTDMNTGSIPMMERRALNQLQNRIRWRGDGNLYAIRDGFTGFRLRRLGIVPGRSGATTLADWRTLCDAEGESSAEAATGVLETLMRPAELTFEDVSPSAFRLAEDRSAAGYGADPPAVGPLTQSR